MKTKRNLLAMPAVLLALGLFLIGCPNDTTVNTDPKSITITGLSGRTGDVAIGIYSQPNVYTGKIAAGQGTISGDSVAVMLKNEDGGDWTDSGAYYILIAFEGLGHGVYFYAAGKIISSDADIPRYNITGATTTIAFDQFEFTIPDW
jgi:hypothetical protein